MAKKSSSTISQKRKPRLLWANPFCLLDTSSGASMTVRQMLHQLVQHGYEVQVLGCTIFDNPKGMGRLKEQYPDFKTSLHQLIEIEDGALSHQVVVTARTTRNHLTTHEEGLWYSQYLYMLDSFKPDIVWFYGGQTLDLLIPDEARTRGIPSAFYLANGSYKAVRWCRDIDLILTDSQSTADMYRTSKNAGFAATPVGKFIDPANFVAETHERKRLLFVNPSWQKGASVVVQLALALEQKRPDIQLEVVEARADWSAVLRETTKKLGEERATLSNVIVTPNTSDMRGPYSRARLLLAPSLWWESSGRVLAEAMLNGVPALITNRGGMPEMIGDAGIAFDFPEECYEAPHQHLLNEEQLQPLYDAILDFYDDTALYEEYVQRAWTVGKQRHHIDQATERLTRALAPFVKLRAGNKDFTAAQQKRHRQGLASIASKPTFKVDASLLLQNQKPGRSEKSMPLVRGDFDWQIEGKIIVLDSRAKLLKMGAAENLTKTGAFGIIAFDPASEVSDPKQYEGSETTQVFQHALLGDGNPATLHTCLDAGMSSTLEPLPQEELPEQHQQGAKVLTKLPINTIALDSIEGLPGLDWLILDELSDTATILEHGQKTLKDTLIIQARIAFQPTHKHQPSLGELQHWASRNGFRFYRLNTPQHQSQLPENTLTQQNPATELQSADSLFLPSYERMATFTDNKKTKLAFLLHSFYGIKDMAYKLLAEVSEKDAKKYLAGDRTFPVTDDKGVHRKKTTEKAEGNIIAKSGNNLSYENYNELPKNFSQAFKEKMNPFGQDSRKHIEIVTESGLCSSCGACSGVCHIEGAITYKEDTDGNIIPEVQDSCVNCGVCLAICPGIYYPEASAEEPYDAIEGKVVSAGVGKSSNIEMFDHSQSGGLVTAVASFLLKTQKVTGVVVTMQDMQASTPYKAKTIIARNTEELVAAQKSTYLPSPNLDKISDILKEAKRDEKLAWVGLSCHMAALENMKDFKKFKVGILDKIEYRLGLICDRVLSNASSEYLTLRAGANRAKVENLIYRDKSLPRGYPGDVNIIEREGVSKVLPADVRMSIKNYFTPSRCHLCHDKMNLHADIVFGDPHGLANVDRRNGETVFLARNDRGDQLMKEVQKYAFASWRHVSKKAVFEGQHVDNIKKNWESMKKAWSELNGEVPQYIKSVDYSGDYPQDEKAIISQKGLLNVSLKAREFKSKSEYARYVLQRANVNIDPLYVRDKPLVAQVIGANYTNKGAMMMLLSIAQKLREKGVVVTLPPGAYNKNSLLYDLVPSIKGLVDLDDIDFVFDASGFLYTDQWYPLPMRLNIDKRFQSFKDKGAKVFLLPQAFGPFENTDLREVMGKALSCATLVYPRDPDSKKYVESVREPADAKPYKVMPDFTNLLEAKKDATDVRFQEMACIIPNLRMLDRNKTDKEKDAYFSFMQNAIKALYKNKCEPFFLIHEGNGDIALADRINEYFDYKIEVVIEPDPCRLKAIIGSSRILLSSRFHGLVSGLCQAIPSFSVGWSHKYFHLFNDYKFPEGCMPLEAPERDINKMVKRLLFSERQKIVNILEEEAVRQKGDVEVMWGEIFEEMGLN